MSGKQRSEQQRDQRSGQQRAKEADEKYDAESDVNVASSASDEAIAPAAWTLESSKQLTDCRVFQVRRDVSLNPRDGSAHDFYVIEAPGWINIIPLTSDGKVVLIEQYRHGTQEISLEIPGGMIDGGESPAEAAARELLEETGYAAGELVPLGQTRPNPAIQDNWIYTFLARDVEYQHEPEFDGTEHTVVRLAPLEDIPTLISGGAITHALVVVAFHWLALHRREIMMPDEMKVPTGRIKDGDDRS